MFSVHAGPRCVRRIRILAARPADGTGCPPHHCPLAGQNFKWGFTAGIVSKQLAALPFNLIVFDVSSFGHEPRQNRKSTIQGWRILYE